jgi:hypothetical protein
MYLNLSIDLRAVAALAVLAPLGLAAVSAPNTFVNGTVADADAVNANFASAFTEITANQDRLDDLEGATPYGRCAIDLQTVSSPGGIVLSDCSPGLQGGMTLSGDSTAFVAPRSGIYFVEATTHTQGVDSDCSIWAFNNDTGQRAGQTRPANTPGFMNIKGVLRAEQGQELTVYANLCESLTLSFPQHSLALFDYVSVTWVGP